MVPASACLDFRLVMLLAMEDDDERLWLWDLVLVGLCEVVEEGGDGDSTAELGTARDPEPGAGVVGAAPRPFD